MKKLITIMLVISLLAIATSTVLGEGTIRINPTNPIMVGTEQTFTVWIQNGEATDPYIFLVMTDACHSSLVSVDVDWTGDSAAELTLGPGDFTEETEHTEGIKRPTGTTSGAGYTVASLMDHLGTTNPIWWAFEPFLDGSITGTPTPFNVTIESDDPRMLVYALGKSSGSGLFDLFVPPTIPGFMVPEPATIAAIATSMLALAAFAFFRKRRL